MMTLLPPSMNGEEAFKASAKLPDSCNLKLLAAARMEEAVALFDDKR